jgi:hypothetical protein
MIELGAKLIFINVDDLLRYGCETYLERTKVHAD